MYYMHQSIVEEKDPAIYAEELKKKNYNSLKG